MSDVASVHVFECCKAAKGVEATRERLVTPMTLPKESQRVVAAPLRACTLRAAPRRTDDLKHPAIIAAPGRGDEKQSCMAHAAKAMQQIRALGGGS